MTRWLESLVAALLAVVTVEIYQYFSSPVAPDEVYLYRSAEVEKMAKNCRDERKLLAAFSDDFNPWTYECISPDLPKDGDR